MASMSSQAPGCHRREHVGRRERRAPWQRAAQLTCRSLYGLMYVLPERSACARAAASASTQSWPCATKRAPRALSLPALPASTVSGRKIVSAASAGPAAGTLSVTQGEVIIMVVRLVWDAQGFYHMLAHVRQACQAAFNTRSGDKQSGRIPLLTLRQKLRALCTHRHLRLRGGRRRAGRRAHGSRSSWSPGRSGAVQCSATAPVQGGLKFI
jgi:hypothetical protein